MNYNVKLSGMVDGVGQVPRPALKKNVHLSRSTNICRRADCPRQWQCLTYIRALSVYISVPLVSSTIAITKLSVMSTHVNNSIFGKICSTLIGLTNIHTSQLSDTFCWRLFILKSKLFQSLYVLNQVSISPLALDDVSVLADLVLGHLALFFDRYTTLVELPA